MPTHDATDYIQVHTTEAGVEYVVTALIASTTPRRLWIEVERVEQADQVVNDALRAIAQQQGTQ